MEKTAEELGLSGEEIKEREVLLQKTIRFSSLEPTETDQTALRAVRQELVDWLFRFPDDASVMNCLEWLDTSLEVTARRRHAQTDRREPEAIARRA